MSGVSNLVLAEHSDVGEIAFIDLKAQQAKIRPRIEARLKSVLDHGRYIAGPEIDELESVLVARTGAAAAVACASGTDALVIPLLSAGLQARDAVFIPAFTYNATANAVLLAGGTPVFVDIDPYTLNMDVGDLTRRIDEIKAAGDLRPSAIIPVDLFGAPADYPAISVIAEREGMTLIADAAQSYGGRLNNRNVGDLAPVTATSFFPGKALGAYGEAGAVLGHDPAAAEVWRSIRWHGTDDGRKISVRVGLNGRMDSFQAAVLLEKLAVFDEELAARRVVADIYARRLGPVCRLQETIAGGQAGRSYFSIRSDRRAQLQAFLKARGVPTAIYYETPLHQMPAFAAFAPAGRRQGVTRLHPRGDIP